MAHRTLIEQLVSLNPGTDRERLLARILCGEVYVDGSCIKDPKQPVLPLAEIEVRARRYVGRGGEKLEFALETFGIRPAGAVWLDAGASTGGFTDCLLQHGARFVHAVDVGRNQLAYSLRRDERVGVMGQTNILSVESLDPKPDMAAADLSFRSLSGAARHLLLLTEAGQGIVLIKPQFEWVDPPPDFSGTVPPELALGIARSTLHALESEGVYTNEFCESPITGRKGNREFLALISL